TTTVSVGHWGMGPAFVSFESRGRAFAAPQASGALGSVQFDAPSSEQAIGEPTSDAFALTRSLSLMFAWLAGVGGFLEIVVWRYVRLARSVARCPEIDEGPWRVTLERTAIDLQIRHVPDLHTTELVSSPFLFGAIRPRIVLPAALAGKLDATELRAI